MKKISILLAALILLLCTACSDAGKVDNANEKTTSPSTNEQQVITEQLAKEQDETVDKEASPHTNQTENKENTNQSHTTQNENKEAINQSTTTQTEPDDYDYVLIFPSDRYPETALHILGAIEQGHSDVCTIDRDGADANRAESLKGIDTRDGYDRDEWPMAMCEEGGKGASVAYISPSDNRGAGSWVGNELSQYEDGTKVLFIVEKPKNLFPEQSEQVDQPKQDVQSSTNTNNNKDIVYKNCSEAREAGVTPLYKGDPGYSGKLDRDGDGIACE